MASISEIKAAHGRNTLPPKLHYPAVHPVSDRFPMMSRSEFESLLQDISVKGMRRPIALYEGKVIDGRARLAIAEHLGLQPRYWIVRREDPAIFLIKRHSGRYGAPRSQERDEALALLAGFDEGKRAARAERKQWIAEARREMRFSVGRPEPCAVCRRHIEFVHAHHSLPLNVQFDLGIENADHTHDWLCPVHHQMVHAFISVYMIGSKNGEFLDAIPDHLAPQWGGAEAVYSRGQKLFESYGGQSHSWARWHDQAAFE